MKNKLLILLLFLLPWQALTAAERNYVHVIGGGQGTVYFVQHYTEHVDQVLHHHDDDAGSSGSHQDIRGTGRDRRCRREASSLDEWRDSG